jgi:hypothetical protein
MPISEILHQALPGRLLSTNTVLEQQVLLVAGPIHGVQHHRLQSIAESLATTSSHNWLKLLEVGDDSAERRVRLLLNTCKETLPLFVGTF